MLASVSSADLNGRFWSGISQMTVEAKKSQASQMLVTCQAERLQTEAQLASSRHPAVRSAGQQES